MKAMKDFNFNYPVLLTEEEEGGYLVRFPDFPEAITQGESVMNSLREAADCLEEAIANRIMMKLEIPRPTVSKKYRFFVSLNAIIAAKAALYLILRENKLSNVGLSKKLNRNEKEIRRLLDPHYHSKLPSIEEALHVLGRRLEISVVSSNPESIKKRTSVKQKLRSKVKSRRAA